MDSGLASLHKILKDETRRKIVLLLNEKNSLSYTELMKALEIDNTGRMNYHLKVLGDLIFKKDDGQYALTGKGKLASRLLLEFPEENRRQLGMKPKWWRKFWIAQAIIATGFLIFFLISYFIDYVSFSMLYQSIFFIISGIGIAYMITHILKDVLSEKERLRFNRALFIMFGIFIIGFFQWIALMTFLRDSGINRLIINTFGKDFAGIFAIISYIMCYVAGGYIGNWIGKKRDYRISKCS